MSVSPRRKMPRVNLFTPPRRKMPRVNLFTPPPRSWRMPLPANTAEMALIAVVAVIWAGAGVAVLLLLGWRP